MKSYVDFPEPTGQNISVRRAKFFAGLPNREILELDYRWQKEKNRAINVVRFGAIVGSCLLIALAAASLAL